MRSPLGAIETVIDTSKPGWENLLEFLVDRREHLAARRRYRRGEVCDE